MNAKQRRKQTRHDKWDPKTLSWSRQTSDRVKMPYIEWVEADGCPPIHKGDVLFWSNLAAKAAIIVMGILCAAGLVSAAGRIWGMLQ